MIKASQLFLKNKYTRWYYRIVNNALSTALGRSKRVAKGTYTEYHHILPRSLGGTNDHNNMVRLSARAHFVCHLLLIKMTKGKAKKAMIYAAFLMTGQHEIRSSWIYERLRKDYRRLTSKRRTGQRHSFATCAKMSKIKKGVPLSASHKRGISKATRGENNPSAKLTLKQVRKMRQLRRLHGTSYAKLADQFSVSFNTVRNIIKYGGWKDE